MPVIDEFHLSLRITLVKPPAQVTFAVQQGSADLFEPQISNGGDLSFTFTIRVKGDPNDGPPRLLGEFTQGPPTARFVYVNSGKRAGDYKTQWDRRAKIPLGDLDWPLILQARSKPKSVLEVKIPGTGRDGGPTCASVKLGPDPWRLVRV